jgi:hypothetical protein
MASVLLIWTEALDAQSRIVFQWNGRDVLIETAFNRLQRALEAARQSNSKVRVLIKGRLGRDVQWESIVLAHVKQQVRQVFTAWYTQAVQAQAALVKQRVARPSFD